HLVDVNTPYIDSLASSGIRFSNGYATHHTCAPSRAAILSGRYQQRLGFYEIWEVQKGIPEKEKLLPQYLKEAGYHTALIGKWHLGEKAYNHPTAKGYDRFYGFLGGMHDYFDPFIGDSWEGGARGFAPIFDQTDTVRDINYLTIEFTDQALGFIENCGSLPFFLTLSYNAPHVMLQAPPEYIERYEGTKGKYRMIRAMNKVLDDQIGRLLHFLEARDLRKNTMIIYVSDNGGTRINHNWKLKGAKSWFYEGGIRVPFIISYPVVLPSRTVFDAPVSILDIFPTVLAAAGIADPKDKEPDGKNLLPFLIRNHGPDPHEFLYWSSDPYFDRWAVRNGDWKAIRESEDLNGKPGVALYNLRNDVGEEKNLIGRYPEKFKELERLYRKWIGGMPPSLVGDDEWTPNGNGWMYKYKESK
ncbi:MAG TPA: sulfatase-like hydrolase/transferase, partial [Anseongella sp.]